MTEILRTMPKSRIEEFWNDKLTGLRSQVELGEQDPLSVSFLELMERAMDYHQYEMDFSGDNYIPVTRMVKIRMNMPRKMIEQLFDVKTTSVYYTGLYIPMEGLLVSEGMRKRSNYDNSTKKGCYFDLASHMPEGFREEYEERLAVPAMGGLFIPKRSAITRSGYLNRPYQIQFFDIML